MESNLKYQILDELHKIAGYCAHCGKYDCAGRASNSRLPSVVSTDDVIKAIDAVIQEPTHGR